MNELSFNNANNWNDFPELKKPVNWQQAPENEPHIHYIASPGDNEWQIRINDFPDEPCYTLIINKEETIHFDDWPSFWTKP